MPEILDLAESFRRKSQLQASVIEQSGEAALKQLEAHWKAALKRSGKSLEDDIRDHSQRMRKALMWSWAGPLVVCLTALLVLSGVTLWQGRELVATLDQVKAAKATLVELEKRGGGVKIHDCEGQPCVTAEPSKYELGDQPLYLLKGGR